MLLRFSLVAGTCFIKENFYGFL